MNDMNDMNEDTNVESALESPLTWRDTDPDKMIELAQYTGYKDNTPTPMICSYRSLFDMFAEPDPQRRSKAGPAYMIGPCRGRRAGANLSMGYIAVIDADSSISDTREVVEGAPHPVRVHEALMGWGISHCIYTTFSHGTDAGNRYRVVIPAEVHSTEELQALVVYIVELLQVQAGIPLALSRESYVWGQGWNKPRVAYQDAEFLYRSYFGRTPDPVELANIYGFVPGMRQRTGPIRDSRPFNPYTPAGVVEKFMPIPQILESAGYSFVHQSIMLNDDGVETTVLRYQTPGSTSSPGVVVFQQDGRWRAYSHSTNDPLCNGFANDALDVYQLVNGFTDQAQALISVVPILEEFCVDEMQRSHPTIMEGGSKFKFGNEYVDDFGSSTYRLLDMQAFIAAMQNQPGVPILVNSDGDDENIEEGELQIMMKSRAEYWRLCRRRILYNGIIYHPCAFNEEPIMAVEKGSKLYFNSFRDWHFKAKQGEWPLLRWHLLNAVCGGIEEEFEYLLNWFAHLFQYPQEKPQVALVLQGGRGWGKSMLLSELARKMGTHAFIAGNNRLLTGNFNSHLRNKLLLVVEESFWSGSHKDRGVLQHIITDPITGYEQKGVDAEAGLSFLRVAMITNNDWAVPAGTDERRYFIPSICDISKQQKMNDIAGGNKQNHFFIRLLTELRNGGLEAFAKDMAERVFDRDAVRVIPQTSKLMEQKEMSLDWIDKWLMEALQQGNIHSKQFGTTLWTSWGCSISHQSLKEALKEATPQSVHYNDRNTINMALSRLASILGKPMVRKESAAEGLRHIFGDVTACRTKFESYCGFPVSWE